MCPIDGFQCSYSLLNSQLSIWEENLFASRRRLPVLLDAFTKTKKITMKLRVRILRRHGCISLVVACERAGEFLASPYVFRIFSASFFGRRLRSKSPNEPMLFSIKLQTTI